MKTKHEKKTRRICSSGSSTRLDDGQSRVADSRESPLHPDAFVTTNTLRYSECRRRSIKILGGQTPEHHPVLGKKGYLWARQIDAGTMTRPLGRVYLVLYLEVPDCGFRDDCGCWDKGYSEQALLVVGLETLRWHLRRPSDAM